MRPVYVIRANANHAQFINNSSSITCCNDIMNYNEQYQIHNDSLGWVDDIESTQAHIYRSKCSYACNAHCLFAKTYLKSMEARASDE